MKSVTITNGPLHGIVKVVPEIRIYFWFPIANNQWAYYYLYPTERNQAQRRTGKSASEGTLDKKQKASVKPKQKTDAHYFFNPRNGIRNESDVDVQTFLNAYESKYGDRPKHG